MGKTIGTSWCACCFGFIDLKTHAKCTLVVRKEKNNYLQKYVHLSTGNYNSSTAKLYTDIGHLTQQILFYVTILQMFLILLQALIFCEIKI